MYPRIALRNLARQRGRTVAAGLAVAVAVSALVFADAWARGIGDAIRSYAASSRLGAVQIHAPGYLDDADAFRLDRTLAVDDTVARVHGVEGVRGVAPRVRFAATGSNGTDETMVLGLGIDPAAEHVACPRFLADELLAGRSLTADDQDAALVGSGLARSLGLAPGSALVLEARDRRGRQNAIDVQVVGVASSSLPDEAKWLVIVPIATAQRLLAIDGRATSVVLGGDADDVEALAARARSAAPGTDVRTWRELGAYFEQAVRTFAFAQRFLTAVLAVLVVLVLLNVAIVTTAERTQEIGTLTALGASARTVRALLVLEAAFFGAGAGGVGALLGVAGSALAAMNGVPFTPPNQPMVLVFPNASVVVAVGAVVGAVVLCVVGTFIPAWFASRARPAIALRVTG